MKGDFEMIHLHHWDWDGKNWICLDCGKSAESTDAHIEPCLMCGKAVEADEVYCAACLEGGN